MKTLIKNARQKKGLMLRELAQSLGIDQALVSKFESGTRKPTKDQLVKIGQILDIDLKELKVQWLKEKILYQLEDEEFAIEALMIAEQELKTRAKSLAPIKIPKAIKPIIHSIDKL